MSLFGQLLKELDKESDEFKWLDTKVPKEYLSNMAPEDDNKSHKVLVINISDNNFDCPGMLSEEKVLLEYESSARLSKVFNDSHSISSNEDEHVGDEEEEEDERENNLSVSNHHSRIGSSSHRNADGLSEFNFSERDTPIMSGRDTPSSHSQDEIRRPTNVLNSISNNAAVLASNPQMNNLVKLSQKSHREDINDKFCKFEINKGF